MTKKTTAKLIKNISQTTLTEAQPLAQAKLNITARPATPPAPIPSTTVPIAQQRTNQTRTVLGEAVNIHLHDLTQKQSLQLTPKETSKLSKQTQATIIASILTARGQEMTVENIQKTTKSFLKSRGISSNDTLINKFAQDLAKKTQHQAELINRYSPYSLTKNQREKLAQEPHPLTNPLSPKALLGRMIRMVTTPAIETLKTAAESENVAPEWQSTIQLELTPRIIEYSIEVYKKAALADNHPLIQELEMQKTILETQTETTAAKILAAHSRFRWHPNELFLLPKSNIPLFIPPEYTVARRPRFSLSYPLKFLYRKTLGRAWNAFSQSSFGSKFKIGITRFFAKKMGVKFGAKKVVTWAATKLGLKALLAAIPEPVVSKILLIGSVVLGWVKKAFKKLWEKPELAIIGGVTFFAVGTLMPLLPVLGLIFKTVGLISSTIGFLGGAAKWLGSLAAKAGSLLTSAATTLSSSLGFLTTASVPAGLALVPVGAVGLVGGLTLFTVVASTARFHEGRGEWLPEAGDVIPARTLDRNHHLAENIIYILKNECQLSHVTPGTFDNLKNCLRNPKTSESAVYLAGFNIEAMIEDFRYSVKKIGPEHRLQCVGFVRGVMSALGADPGWNGSGDAKSYLQKHTDIYQVFDKKQIDLIEVGDIVVSTYGEYGHMGIVVSRTEDEIFVAQAWGSTGKIDVRSYEPVVFQGFLRRK